MKSDVKFLGEIRKEFAEFFEYEEFGGKDWKYKSFHDMLWNIIVKRSLEDEKEPVIFHVNVMGEHGNELVFAYASGGFRGTGVYFISAIYTTCCDVVEKLNEKLFQIDIKEQTKLLNKSMFSKRRT